MKRILIKTNEAAEMLGCSSKTIKRMDFEKVKLNNAPNSPIYVFKAEIERFIKDLRKERFRLPR